MKRLFSQMKWFLEIYRRQYLMTSFAILISYVATLIPLRLIGHISDRIVARSITIPELLQLVGLMLGLTLLLYGFTYFWHLYLFKAEDVLGRELRRRLVAKYLLQSPPFFARNSTGSLMSKATNDVDAVQILSAYGVMSLFDSTVYPLAVIVVMASLLSWKLTLIAILPLPFLVVASRKVGSTLNTRYDESQQAFDQMNERVLENVSGVRVLRAYVQEEAEKKTFAAAAENLMNKTMAVVRYSALFPVTSRVISGLSTLLAAAFGILFVSRGEMTMGDLVSFIVYLHLLSWPMLALGEFINVAEQGLASMDRIDELLCYREDMVDHPDALPYPGRGTIDFRQLNFAYPDTRKEVLSDVSFTLPAGQTLGIVGPIGSGKTTLLKQLLRFYPIAAGAVWLGDWPIEAYTIDSVRAAVGYVPQQQILFSRSIEDNIRMGERDGSTVTLEQAVDLSDFHKDLAQLPDGLATQAGERGIALSGGQKQRIAIARALIGDPEILILDDSLSAVDAATSERILASLRKTRSGKTTLIASHRLATVVHADLILVLQEGRIVEEGSHEELMSRDNWYRRQFLRQQLESEGVA